MYFHGNDIDINLRNVTAIKWKIAQDERPFAEVYFETKIVQVSGSDALALLLFVGRASIGEPGTPSYRRYHDPTDPH